MANGTATLPEREVRHEERRIPEQERGKGLALGGTTVSGILAAVAGVLSIVGLAGTYPGWMVTIATVVLGVSFLLEGGAIALRWSSLLREMAEERMTEMSAGITGEALAGITGIVLGILGLLGVAPGVVIPCAALVFGAALVMGAGANVRVNGLMMTYGQGHPIAQQAAHEAVLAATGLQVLIALGAITLGILGLVAILPLTLSLVAVLMMGVTLLFSNATIAGRVLSVLPR